MNEMILHFATSVPGFLMAIVFHEAAHAYVAWRFGDDTARSSGRLSLNPIVHFDLFGTVIIPAISLIAGGVFFGYAKPVPVDPRRFKKIRSGIFWVSFAGPLANLFLAVMSMFLLAIMKTKVPNFSMHLPIHMMLQQSVMINLVLFTFNLIPFPPLDGSKMISVFMNYDLARRFEGLQRYAMLFFIVLIATSAFRYLMFPALLFSHYVQNWFIYIIG